MIRTDSGWEIHLQATGLPRLDNGAFYQISSSGALHSALGPENVMLGRRLARRRRAALDRAV
jgi:hypothetical protein